MAKVLVTGGTGFVGGHIIVQLLKAGHDVRTTLRDVARADQVRALVSGAGADVNALAFAIADLGDDAGWDAAVAGCDYVLHVASPFPANAPKHEDELIIPARDGALRVLRAARDAGVKRVVLTSSFGAIGYGGRAQKKPFDETMWTDIKGKNVSAYVKSKTIAERAAWDFVAREGSGLELSVINPVGIFGPLLGPDLSPSLQLIKRMLEGGIPACPKLWFGVVDVRDVGDLHIRAMTSPAAAGERFLACGEKFVSMFEMAQMIRRNLGAAGAKAPTRQLPNWMVRFAAMRDPAIRQTLPELGKVKNGTNGKARMLLGWNPRANEEAIVASALSLVKLGQSAA